MRRMSLASLLVVPRPPDQQDNWIDLIGAGAAGGFASGIGADIYVDVKAAFRTAVKKLRDRLSDPDEEQEWVHQLVAEAFIGPCPAGHKLVHANGDRSDNKLVNLAYVPKSDPRAAAPLKPRPPGWFEQAEPTGKAVRSFRSGQ
jgi:hypothetical protein